MKYLAGLTITEAQFEELRRICPTDHEFPRDWTHWSDLVAKAAERAQEEGFVAKDLPLDINAFKKWCGLVGVVPCIDALRAYAIVTRAKIDDKEKRQSAPA